MKIVNPEKRWRGLRWNGGRMVQRFIPFNTCSVAFFFLVYDVSNISSILPLPTFRFQIRIRNVLLAGMKILRMLSKFICYTVYERDGKNFLLLC